MSAFDKRVFINCPFDNPYFPILKSIMFCLIYLNFDPQIAETTDSGANRLNHIKDLVRKSRFSIHDLSRIQLSGAGLPRFNMPLECGIDLGAKLIGTRRLKTKSLLILETEKYRYQKFISDIAGNDIRAHKDDPELAMKQVRNWLRINTGEDFARHSDIWVLFNEFESDYNAVLDQGGYDPLNIEDTTFSDIIHFMKRWVRARHESVD